MLLTFFVKDPLRDKHKTKYYFTAFLPKPFLHTDVKRPDIFWNHWWAFMCYKYLWRIVLGETMTFPSSITLTANFANSELKKKKKKYFFLVSYITIIFIDLSRFSASCLVVQAFGPRPWLCLHYSKTCKWVV